jgi:hypothetical protein
MNREAKEDGTALDIKVGCDISDVKEAEKKVERLVELLKEANTLVDELASKEIDLKINV